MEIQLPSVDRLRTIGGQRERRLSRHTDGSKSSCIDFDLGVLSLELNSACQHINYHDVAHELTHVYFMYTTPLGLYVSLLESMKAEMVLEFLALFRGKIKKLPSDVLELLRHFKVLEGNKSVLAADFVRTYYRSDMISAYLYGDISSFSEIFKSFSFTLGSCVLNLDGWLCQFCQHIFPFPLELSSPDALSQDDFSLEKLMLTSSLTGLELSFRSLMESAAIMAESMFSEDTLEEWRKREAESYGEARPFYYYVYTLNTRLKDKPMRLFAKAVLANLIVHSYVPVAPCFVKKRRESQSVFSMLPFTDAILLKVPDNIIDKCDPDVKVADLVDLIAAANTVDSPNTWRSVFPSQFKQNLPNLETALFSEYMLFDNHPIGSEFDQETLEELSVALARYARCLSAIRINGDIISPLEDDWVLMMNRHRLKCYLAGKLFCGLDKVPIPYSYLQNELIYDYACDLIAKRTGYDMNRIRH